LYAVTFTKYFTQLFNHFSADSYVPINVLPHPLPGISQSKVTPNKFPVSHPDYRHVCMRVGSPFPLFHMIVSFSSYCLPETTEKSAQKHFKAAKLTQT